MGLTKKDQSTIDLVVGLTCEAAQELGVPPHEVQYNTLQKHCKAHDKTELFDLAGDIRRLGGFTNIRDAKFPCPGDAEALPVAKMGFADLARDNRKQAVLSAREHVFFERFEELSTKVFSKKVVPAGFAKKTKLATKGIQRELNILLSDTHFGSDLDERYVPLKYGRVEEARRLAAVVKQVCEYKRQYRGETRLRVHLGGDIIQGQLHDTRDGDILAAQCARAIHLLTQAVAVFASEFPEVIVDCTTGNHDRFTSRHKERATYEKSDSLATVIYFSVKTAVRNLKNVTVEIPRTPFVSFESFGAKCFGTHGDTVLNPGYPGSMVNVRTLENQINKINAALPNADEYRLFFVGHVHVGMLLHMGNGAILITNGPLIPSDQYSVSIGLFENNCGQWMWESVPGHVVGDSRFITVNGMTDKDEALDSIIQAFDRF
jgi:hypothetical protein